MNAQIQLKAGEHFGLTGQEHYFPSTVTSESVYQERADLPKHAHELGFFTLVVNGSYFDRIRGREESFEPMNVVWREEGITHKDRIGDSGGRFFFLEVKPKLLRKLREIDNPPSRLIQQNGALTWLALRLRREIGMAERASHLIVEGITLEMLGHLARVRVGDHAPVWLGRVVDKLNDEFTRKICIDNLALEAGVHPTRLTRTFRRYQYCSIGEYVQDLRVRAASRMLVVQDIPLAEIALESGFSDQSHLTRIFKRITGTTPAAFRRNLS